ncbi:MAG: hypothetical protein QG651_1157 [Pseudomonadota bacterium]|nr:hypothetical protein [Pseudomonadota bacterium]
MQLNFPFSYCFITVIFNRARTLRSKLDILPISRRCNWFQLATSGIHEHLSSFECRKHPELYKPRK